MVEKTIGNIKSEINKNNFEINKYEINKLNAKFIEEASILKDREDIAIITEGYL